MRERWKVSQTAMRGERVDGTEEERQRCRGRRMRINTGRKKEREEEEDQQEDKVHNERHSFQCEPDSELE